MLSIEELLLLLLLLFNFYFSCGLFLYGFGKAVFFIVLPSEFLWTWSESKEASLI